MSRVKLAIVGVVLLTIPALWFFTSLGGVFLEAIGAQAHIGARGAGDPSSLEILNTVLNGANALSGILGAILMIRSAR